MAYSLIFYIIRIMDTILAKKINQMAREDQKIRNGHKKGIKLDLSIEKNNTAALKKIIKKYGWPTTSLVGKKASFNAWLLAQHADHDRKFQETVLMLLKRISKTTHDVDTSTIAYLTDRLLVAKKKQQKFGTQFKFDKKGRLILYPIKNLKGIDLLRKEYHLPPLKDFIKMADKFNAKLEQ